MPSRRLIAVTAAVAVAAIGAWALRSETESSRAPEARRSSPTQSPPVSMGERPTLERLEDAGSEETEEAGDIVKAKSIPLAWDDERLRRERVKAKELVDVRQRMVDRGQALQLELDTNKSAGEIHVEFESRRAKAERRLAAARADLQAIEARLVELESTDE